MEDKARIIKVKKNPNGDITDVMLQNGNVYSINEAITMAEDGLIIGAQEDNLDNMPDFYLE